MSWVLLGCESAFTSVVLGGLLESGLAPSRFGLYRPTDGSHRPPTRFALPVEDAASVAAQAARAGIPVAPIGNRIELAALGTGPRPERLLCACFPLLLPPSLLGWPRRGCLNLHPAPLPAFRGPSPLFWQLRAGVEHGEICVHRMEARCDAGAVLARAPLDFTPGARASETTRALARLGVPLAVAALRGAPLTATPQDEALASRQGWPRPRDFGFDTDWPVTRAYGFVRGTAEWGWPFEVHSSRGVLRIRDAFGYDRTTVPQPPVRIERSRSRVRIALADGVLDACLAAPVDGVSE